VVVEAGADEVEDEVVRRVEVVVIASDDDFEVEDEVVRRVEVVVIVSDDDVEDEVEDVDDTVVLVGQAMATHSPRAGSSPGWQL
jgi:D-Tyr-tRNAtyr deacylase